MTSLIDIIKILGEAGNDSNIVRHLPAVDRSFLPIWQKQKPWLEQENNLMVAALLEAIRQFEKGLVGSGFLEAGLYSYPGAADSTFRMAESRVAVDGMSLHVSDPDNSHLNNIVLPAPTGVRNDLAFLEVWVAEIARTGATFGNTSIYKQGGVGNGTYANDIQDPTMAALSILETTRRRQIRWRIRTKATVDFATYPYGVNDPTVLAQGDKGAPVATYVFTEITTEKGKLFVAGAGNAQSFTDLGSLSGYVFAIPIAKVARTASAIIAAPDVTDLRQIVSYAATIDLHEHEYETPTGVIDGVNPTFTLSFIPNPSDSLVLFSVPGGARLNPGGGNDYTLAGKTITYLAGSIPVAGTSHHATYQHTNQV